MSLHTAIANNIEVFFSSAISKVAALTIKSSVQIIVSEKVRNKILVQINQLYTSKWCILWV